VEVSAKISRSSGWEILDLGERFQYRVHDDGELVRLLYRIHQALVAIRQEALLAPEKSRLSADQVIRFPRET